MNYKNFETTGSVRHNNRFVSTIYKAGRIVWQYIRSCFGKGYWINEKPWSNTDAWKNNK